MICIPIRIQLHLILQKEKTTLHQNRTTTFYWLGSVLPSKLLLLVFALILDLWRILLRGIGRITSNLGLTTN